MHFASLSIGIGLLLLRGIYWLLNRIIALKFRDFTFSHSPTDTRSLEVGFSSMSVGTQSTKGHTIRPPVLSISSTSGDGSVLLKQYQSPSCPLPQTQGFGAWPYAVLDSGTLHPSFHCNYYTRDNREAAVPPVRDSSDSIDYNLEGTTSPAVFDIGKRVDQSDVFLKSGMGRAPGSRPKFAPGGGAALDSKKTDNSLSRLSTPDVRGMKNSGGECRPTIEQPESGGLSLSPLISRSVVSGTKGSMGCSSLGMSNASEFSENASSAKPFNRWDLEQGNATGQRLDRPIAMRDRAFSSPGPMEASRLGSGSIAPVGVATHSPSAKSLSDVWEDGRFNEHDLTSSNVQFRNFTGGHIPELSSTDNENLSCTGFFGGIRRGRSLMAFNLPYDNVEKKEFCENEVKRDFSCDVAQHDDSNFLYNARNDAQGTSSLPLAGNNEQYIKECRVFGDNGSRARATSFGEVMHSGFLINSPWGGNRGGDREGIGVPADRTGSIVDEHQSEQLAQCSQYHRSTRSETNNFFEPFLGGGGGGQNMSDDLVCRDTIIGDEAGCSPPPGLP